MTDKAEPLRGDAAWRAQRDAIAKRNDAVHARAEREKQERNVEEMKKRNAEDRRERENLPEQPRPL
ncbi:MAG TPA: hypothetical protein VF587_13380 [Solirubrobacteraceae bacterium]|jgi:hypothetical protein